jgi:hypothetical protein
MLLISNAQFFSPHSSERDPVFGKSHGSIDSALKLDASDTDSMSEYAETDPSKFNEDGSFIGQYGGKRYEPESTPTDYTPSSPPFTTFKGT